MAFTADISQIKIDLSAMRVELNLLTDIVSQQAKIIRDFEDERQRQLGAKGAIKFMWFVVTSGIAGIAYAMHDILAFLFPRH